MPHFVYMLKCAGNRIYTGYAVDVEARFEQHKSGKGARFTKAFPPERILRTFELETKEAALRLEARIKKLPRVKKELLAGGDELLEAALKAGLGSPMKRRIRRKKRALHAAENAKAAKAAEKAAQSEARASKSRASRAKNAQSERAAVS